MDIQMNSLRRMMSKLKRKANEKKFIKFKLEMIFSEGTLAIWTGTGYAQLISLLKFNRYDYSATMHIIGDIPIIRKIEIIVDIAPRISKFICTG